MAPGILDDVPVIRSRSVQMNLIEPPAFGSRRRGDGPIVLRRSADGSGYVVVRGHAAFFRAERVQAERVPCLLREDDPDEDPLELLAEISALGGHDPIEEAEALLQAMTRLGVESQRELSRITGIRQPHISKRLKLLRLSPRHRRLLRDGRLTIEEALKIGSSARPTAGTAI